MMTNVINRMNHLCETIPGLISEISVEDFLNKPSPAKWSKKEILGHLIDSGVNNHQRFVRVQFEDLPLIAYDSDMWNAAGHYMTYETAELILFWKQYNKHLITLIKNIPEEKLLRLCKTNTESPALTLKFLIEDYVTHLEHHLKQLVKYV